MVKRNDHKDSHIGPGTIFQGHFHVAGSLKIDGKFEGDIKTDNSLIVGENGRLKTDVRARQVVVNGTMIGNIDALEEVRLGGKGRLLGDVKTPRIHLEPGVVFSGKLTITGNQEQNLRDIVTESFKNLA